jgi:hypothetical protein
MKSLRVLATAMVVLAGLPSAPPAKADSVYNLDLTFKNGAIFTGTVTFNSGFTSVTSIDGVLTGYELGTLGFTNNLTDTDTIDVVSYGGLRTGNNLNLVTFEDAGWDVAEKVGKHTFEVPEDNWFTLNFDLANPFGITLITTGIVGNLSGIDGDLIGPHPATPDNQDSTITPAPEPRSIFLLGYGLVGLAVMVRRKIGLRV